MSATAEYVDAVEVARMIRSQLRHAWPTVRFSVRSDRYAGGSSIDIRWTDGPRTAAVERLVKHYEGADFDGMQDLKTCHDTVLVGPNGPRLVHFGADFVFCHRSVSNEHELTERAREIIFSRCAISGEGRHARFGNDWVDNLARGMVCALDFDRGTILQDTFREVVLRKRDC